MNDTTITPPAIVRPAEKDEKWDIHVKAAIGFGKRSIQSCAMAGAELLKAKMACPPGLWIKTLTKHGLSRRSASWLIDKFRQFPDVGNVAHVNQFSEATGLATEEEQEIADRELGDEAAEHPALKIILCKDCRRKGAMRDCKKCAAARAEFVGKGGKGGRASRSKSPKGGKALFDWKDFHQHFRVVYRLPEKLVKAYPEAATSADHDKAVRLLTELADHLKKWQEQIQGAKS